MNDAVDWRVDTGLVDYRHAVAAMERAVAAIADGKAPERVWLLEHPPIYTAGTSARSGDLLDGKRFPIFRTGRGGRYTYHGPGQRVGYVMLDLAGRGRDVRRYVRDLEEWIIAVLAEFGVTGERRPGRVGIWVDTARHGGRKGQEDKIAAIGVRVRRWVTFHGVSLNVDPDLAHYDGIVPCGVSGHGVTSLAKLGVGATMQEVDAALRETFCRIFSAEVLTPSGVW